MGFQKQPLLNGVVIKLIHYLEVTRVGKLRPEITCPLGRLCDLLTLGSKANVLITVGRLFRLWVSSSSSSSSSGWAPLMRGGSLTVTSYRSNEHLIQNIPAFHSFVHLFGWPTCLKPAAVHKTTYVKTYVLMLQSQRQRQAQYNTYI